MEKLSLIQQFYFIKINYGFLLIFLVSENKLNKDLYIYQIDNLKFSKMTPHKENPVISSLKRGRNAGNFFTENNKIYRPSQINKTNNYGYGICISEIKKLDINEYNEKKIKTIKPNLFKNLKLSASFK